MSAGYELKQLVPLKDDYKTVNKSIVPILEFIFDDELSHSISDVSNLSLTILIIIILLPLHFRLRGKVSLMFCSHS